MTAAPVVLKINGLTVRRESRILNDIKWQVRKGERWCLMGANGSGKTTLINTIYAYFAFTKGSIELLGKKYGEYDWFELRKKIGLVSQNLMTKINPSQKTLDVVHSGKEALLDYSRAVDKKDINKCLRILSWAGVRNLARAEWGRLSQGEKQRVLICRALMAEYKLLLLDEPCAGLDPVARDQLLAFLNNLALANPSLAIITVTHHVEEIVDTVTHVLLLKKGRVFASGKKSTVLRSDSLSAAFEHPVRLTLRRGTYRLEMLPRPVKS